MDDQSKPGDRVRVTFEGVLQQKFANSVVGGHVSTGNAGSLFSIPAGATVEVLAKPVYVNSDTTEFKWGDIAKLRNGVVLCRRNEEWYRADSGGPCYPPDGATFTLLVRNGEVVPQ